MSPGFAGLSGPVDPGHRMARQAVPGYGLGKPECPTKPFSGTDEASLKQESVLMALDQTTRCVMLGHIISFVYRGLCRQYLNAMRREHRWA